MCCALLYYRYMYIDLTVYLWICIFILVENRDFPVEGGIQPAMKSNWLVASYYQKKSKQKVTTGPDSLNVL